MNTPEISVVVPIYGCETCLELLVSRLEEQLDAMGCEYEMVFVDDRSPDRSWAVLDTIAPHHPRLRRVRLSRNFGQHLAITAGLAHARGAYVVVMDCDLQDPPEKIPELYAAVKAGHDLVLARRIERSHSWFRRLSARVYFKLASTLAGRTLDGSFGTFSILSRKVVDAFLLFKEPDRHYLFVLHWLGFSAGVIEYRHEERASGQSSYTLRQLFKHAINGLIFQATVLLKWIVTVGLLFAVSGIVLAAGFVVSYFKFGAVPGWTSMAVLLLVSTGVVLTSLGIIGLYVGNIFDQVKGRPLYVVDEIKEGGRS